VNIRRVVSDIAQPAALLASAAVFKRGNYLRILQGYRQTTL
jgi:hypothetical protein